MENNEFKMPLSMESEALARLRLDMDAMLTSTIADMTKYGNGKAKLAVAIDIELDNDMLPDGQGGHRQAVVPTIKHKVKTQIQVKGERGGEIPSGYELLWDQDNNCFYLRHQSNNQISIFDEDEEKKGGFDYEVFGGHLEAGGEVTDPEDDNEDLPFEDDEEDFDNEMDDSDNETGEDDYGPDDSDA